MQYEIYLHGYESLLLVSDFESTCPTLCVLKESIQYCAPIHTEVIRECCKLHLDYNKNKLSCNFSPLLNYCNVSVTLLFVHRERLWMCVCVFTMFTVSKDIYLKDPVLLIVLFVILLHVNASMFSLNRPRLLLFALPVCQINRTPVWLTLPQVLSLIEQTVGTYQMWPASWEVEHWCMLDLGTRWLHNPGPVAAAVCWVVAVERCFRPTPERAVWTWGFRYSMSNA